MYKTTSILVFEAGSWGFKQLGNNLEPLSQTSILYLIFHTSVILIVCLQL